MRPDQRERYEQMVAAGESPRLAEMLALQSPPMSNTDREFWHGRWEEDSPSLRRLRREAEAAGVGTAGKFYMGGLAAYPGDPRAWVSDRGDVQRVCEERGWGCQGSVNVRPAPCEPEMVGLADDIVAERVAGLLADHPEPRSVDVGELAHQVRERHTPHWAKGGAG